MNTTTFVLMITTILYGVGIGFVIGMLVAKRIAMKVIKEVLGKYKIVSENE